MKPRNRTILLVTGILAAGGLATPSILTAQAPAGPLPAAQPQPPSSPNNAPRMQEAPAVKPRSSIMGEWKLNRDESDDPRKKMQDARGANRGGGRGVHMGGPGIGGGPYGGRRGGEGNESDEERQRMQELLSPSRSLTVAEARREVEVDVFDDRQRKQAFFTDGRKLQKSKDLNYQEIAAHWDAGRLVSDEKGPRGGKMSRTFELSYDSTQLYETVHMTTGRSNTPVVIRYVYDQPGAAPPASR
jgi:hypothetical protein